MNSPMCVCACICVCVGGTHRGKVQLCPSSLPLFTVMKMKSAKILMYTINNLKLLEEAP